MKLTVSMATFDDYDGVYFTIQSLRLHHALPPNTEFLVMDNNPGTQHSEALGKLARDIRGMRVIGVKDRQSSFVKYDAFAHARGDVILGLDCHVLLAPGFVAELMRHWSETGRPFDMVTGPLLYNDMVSTSVKMAPVWRGHDFGIWADDPEAMKAGVPFEVPMQGMGCFSVRREGIPEINGGFTGFGAEEWYVAEKIRQGGGRVMCHPSLGWNHRFCWRGPSFPLRIWDRVENYYRGWLEIYGSLEHPRIVEMTAHWKTLLPPGEVDALANRMASRLTKPLP